MGVDTGARSYMEKGAEIVRMMAERGNSDPDLIRVILGGCAQLDEDRRAQRLRQASLKVVSDTETESGQVPPHNEAD